MMASSLHHSVATCVDLLMDATVSSDTVESILKWVGAHRSELSAKDAFLALEGIRKHEENPLAAELIVFFEEQFGENVEDVCESERVIGALKAELAKKHAELENQKAFNAKLLELLAKKEKENIELLQKDIERSELKSTVTEN
ncbi:hypothetical protein QR680_007746 [Steinernema hermaphroditum]|nr:hypothetical protein QR680_007746 [Steinernema hermaphroditum]